MIIHLLLHGGWTRPGGGLLRRLVVAAAALLLVGCAGAGEGQARGVGTLTRPGADGAIEPGGAAQEGTISEEGQRVRHAFVAQEGQRLAVSAMAAPDSDLDPYLRIFGPDGELLVEDDDSGDASLDSLAVVVVRTGGRHVAEVAAYRDGSTGDYTVAVEPGEPPRDGEVVLDEAGALRDGDEVARFEFEADEGDEVLVAVDSDGSEFDPIATLLDPGGGEIGSDDDGGSGRNSLIEATLARSGTYVVEVTEFQGDTAGSFRVVVSLS